MIAPIYPTCAADAGVRAIFGDPPRVEAFGLVEQVPARPYAVWQNVSGRAEQFLGDRPDVDYFTLQVDVYADDPVSMIAAAKTLRDALEPCGYITRWGDQTLDEDRKYYRYSFDIDWIVRR